MFKLKVIQALHGDCLILEYGNQDEQDYMLIDGGPSNVYKNYLKDELVSLRDSGGKINLAVLSHVDDDHVNGLLDLLHELTAQRKAGKQETIGIEGLWHNSFGKTLGATVEKGLARQMGASLLPRGSVAPSMDMRARSISQGNDLTAYARGLQIPINVDFSNTPDRLVCVENLQKPIRWANLSIRVVGPTHSTLQALQKEWEAWLAEQEKATKLPKEEAIAAIRELDQSVPNLSSIMLLVEAEGKSVLLTGDGLGDHLLDGLKQAGVLKEDGTYHVDVLKLPHHGSARNVTPAFFERITADTYVICANGKNDNPDFQTLEWLVQAVHNQGRSIRIVATNETASTKKLVAKYDPEKFLYELVFVEPGVHSITLDLSESASSNSSALLAIKGIGPVFAERLGQAGITMPAQVLALTGKQLASILKTSIMRAEKILEAAKLGH
jgi:beta-lactamase superfamily II metal-dependent hydrolase